MQESSRRSRYLFNQTLHSVVTVNVYPHRFRHTYACHLFDNGAPLDFIQGMLGHEKASTPQIYTQLREERRRELYRRYF
ncbi:tyrosine-type recombinase/integrase [Brevibacillus porteri]|uniref:tyrosine-type recombinase/integrase n=1 Tax=Brevibacillus porteri TaxID=2126350 RepID=UPI003D25CC6B